MSERKRAEGPTGRISLRMSRQLHAELTEIADLLDVDLTALLKIMIIERMGDYKQRVEPIRAARAESRKKDEWTRKFRSHILSPDRATEDVHDETDWGEPGRFSAGMHYISGGAPENYAAAHDIPVEQVEKWLAELKERFTTERKSEPKPRNKKGS